MSDQFHPEVQWLPPDDPQNPWGVRVLDVRPFTHNMLSTSKNPSCASNAVSFGNEDGRCFVNRFVSTKPAAPARLTFPIDRHLADGPLFIPRQMEEKWAIFHFGGEILFVRSWLRVVVAVAEVRMVGNVAEVHGIRGQLTAEDETPEFGARVVDFLLRSHALDEVVPAPLPANLADDRENATLWCFSHFGRRVSFAAPELLPRTEPKRPLRSHSLFHIAVARGDASEAEAQLKAGTPIDLLAADGLTPLHWALALQDTSMMDWLLSHGCPVDAPSIEGATPLMNAVQGRSMEQTRFLLDRGANASAADGRGFTSLHRAAEMGQRDIVELLLTRGANPNPSVEGHTPLSLAEARGETAIVAMLKKAMGTG